MTLPQSLRDAWLVARFQLLRSLRTRSALAAASLYLLTSGGAAAVFVRILGELENAAALSLGVPATRRPGAMLDQLRRGEDLRRIVEGLVPDPALVQWALDQPPLTVTHFWVGLVVMPFLAAGLGAEALSPDLASRAVRFELVRTGRAEVLFGRLLGQALLTAAAIALGAVAVEGVALLAMTGQDPVAHAAALARDVPRLWAWSLPFLGMGVAWSAFTRNVHLARVLALATVAASWVVWGALSWPHHTRRGWVAVLTDSLLPILPQDHGDALWGPGAGWLAAAGLYLVMALAVGQIGLWTLSRRDA